MKFSRLASPADPCGALRQRALTPAITAKNHLSLAICSACKRLASAIRLIAMVFPAAAGAVTVSWDSNPETDIASYKVLYGTSCGKPSGYRECRSRPPAPAITGLQPKERLTISW